MSLDRACEHTRRASPTISLEAVCCACRPKLRSAPFDISSARKMAKVSVPVINLVPRPRRGVALGRRKRHRSRPGPDPDQTRRGFKFRRRTAWPAHNNGPKLHAAGGAHTLFHTRIVCKNMQAPGANLRKPHCKRKYARRPEGLCSCENMQAVTNTVLGAQTHLLTHLLRQER